MLMELTQNQIARFNEKITRGTPDECWNWTASGLKTGYGRVRINDRAFLSHRVAWALVYGDPGDFHVLHRCDNPKCCNPAHLFLGTHQENMMDKHSKGRCPGCVGEKNGRAIITREQAEEIRAAYIPRKVTLHALGAQYGLTFSAVHCIVKGKSWT